MTIRLSDLCRNERAAQVSYNGHQVEIVFNPGLATVEWLTQVEAAQRERDILALFRLLTALIVSWGITDDDGGELPPTVDVLTQRVPVGFVQAMAEQMIAGATVNPTSGES